MIIALGLVSLLALILASKVFQLNMQRNYLDQMASVEQTRAHIATELLYEGKAKHQELSFQDTCNLIESIRNEASPIGRKALADRIMGIDEPAKKQMGFF
jgi:hypothetical protein